MILIYFAFVFFVLATLFSDAWESPQGTPLWNRIRFNFIAAGLACWIATLIWK